MICSGIPMAQVVSTTGIAPRTVGFIKKKAKACSYDPKTNPTILDIHVADRKRTGRPKKSKE